jgi:hypothetical protein
MFRHIGILIFGWTTNQILIYLAFVIKDMIKPSVYGQLIDRFLFNFRLDPDYLESQIPVGWLRPRRIHGYGIVSFCLLRLKGFTLWPLPTSMGIDSISSAYRCAVTDLSAGTQEPSVYILGRGTNVPAVSKLGTVLFSGNMRLMNAAMEEHMHGTRIGVNDSQGKRMFIARTKSGKDGNELDSKLFDSVDDFVAFIKGGLSSYTPSTRQGRVSRVDLVEDSNTYTAIPAQIDYSRLDEDWKGSGLEFDSAFHATGGLYRLSYLGTVPAKVHKSEQLTQMAKI